MFGLTFVIIAKVENMEENKEEYYRMQNVTLEKGGRILSSPLQ